MSGDVKAIVCADYFPSAEATPAIEAQSLSQMAKGMQGSKILQIAYAVQARIKAGAQVADFTVGDFAPREFRVPDALITYTTRALEDGHTNYPPADGVPELRQAVQAMTWQSPPSRGSITSRIFGWAIARWHSGLWWNS